MPAKLWTSDKIDFIKKNLHLSDADLASHFSVSDSAIKSARLRYNILRNPNGRFSKDEDKIIKELYSNTKTKAIAEKLKRSIYSIYNRANILNLKKSPEFLASPECGRLYPGHNKGKSTQYPKGHVPANKGKKISAELRKKLKHTFFQKGHKPANTKFNGYISLRKDKRSGITYKVIRVSEGNFKHLHVHSWEKENGPVPEGFIVAFKTTDTMNCDKENLELITRAESMKRNSLYNYPEEIQQLIHTRGQLTRQINKRQEENK